MNSLGVLYQKGQGIEVDNGEAVRWFRAAADAGNAAAMYNLGLAYENGTGVFLNREEAIAWYRRAATAGNAEARASLQRLGAEK